MSKDAPTSGPGPLAAAPGDVAFGLIGFADMLATSTGGDAAASSTVAITTRTPRLRRKGTVRVDGRLTPSAPGAIVGVAMRSLNSGRWSRKLVTVRSDGTFSTTWKVKRSSSFVAQWAGDSALNSDGSPPLRVTLRP